jgi:cell division protein ZapA
MPEVRITIGGRDFDVACQPGEEHFLRTAARMLDNEATALVGQIGRVPEVRMLLMAGLMLADKAAGIEDQLRNAEDRALVAEKALERARDTSVRVDLAAQPNGIAERFAELAAEAEALAEYVEGRAA